jgi:hypothetical protein
VAAAAVLVAALRKAVAGPPKMAAKGGEGRTSTHQGKALAAGALRLLEYQGTAMPRASRSQRALLHFTMGCMRQPNSPDRASSATTDLPAIDRQPNGATEPTFLGEDYVCTELPTHITRARTKEQQALIDQAYEGWTTDA